MDKLGCNLKRCNFTLSNSRPRTVLLIYGFYPFKHKGKFGNDLATRSMIEIFIDLISKN